MFLILLMCLNLSLHASATNLGYICGADSSFNINDEIFLISDKPNDNKGQEKSWNTLFNEAFLEACNEFYKIHNGSLDDAARHRNIIYFRLSDDFHSIATEFNLSYTEQYLETLNLTCENYTTSASECYQNKIVKLISPSIEHNFGEYNVYDLIQNMHGIITTDMATDISKREVRHERNCAPTFQKTQHLKTVVLCREGNTDIGVNIHPLKLIVEDLHNCKATLKKYDYSVLALLAPKGFDDASVHSVPTVLYDTPYASTQDEAAFPNSVTLLPWKLLKYGFLGFLKSVGWERVVIVSDVSAYSIEFEHELTALFDRERIVYTVVKSEDSVFDIRKIAQKLVQVTPRIVIGNLEAKHALYLMRSSYRYINWIVRDHPENLQHELPSNPPTVFTIHLAVTKPNTCNIDANILAGLSAVTRAYKQITDEDHTLGRRIFNKRFSKRTNDILKEQSEEAMVYVHRIWPGKLELISTMRADDNGAEVHSYTNPFKSGKPADGPTMCLAKSYKYFEPCEDNFVMLLMFVVILFFTTSLMISCYFHKTSPFNDIRYQNF